jgi:hypothetical protein
MQSCAMWYVALHDGNDNDEDDDGDGYSTRP